MSFAAQPIANCMHNLHDVLADYELNFSSFFTKMIFCLHYFYGSSFLYLFKASRSPALCKLLKLYTLIVSYKLIMGACHDFLCAVLCHE